MNATPRISVVIPTHDRAAVLPRAVESALRQTLPPDEIVVVDDASGDDTEAALAPYRASGLRVERLARRSGAQAARNHGIRVAHGDWIAFLDSDDEWLPDKLERQVRLLAERGFDPHTVVHGHGVLRENGGEPQLLTMPSIEGPDGLDVLLRGPATLFPALLVSRAALEEIGGLDEDAPSYQEWETSIRLARICRFVEPEGPLFVYHRAADAISRSAVDDVRGYQYVIDKFRDEIVERCGEDAWQEHIDGQVHKALEFKLWNEARRLLALTRKRDARYLGYALCLRLRLRPSYAARVRRFAT